MANGLPVADIQGFLLHDYHMPHLRVFVLQVQDAAAARKAIGGLARGGARLAPVTTAERATSRPAVALNIGFTHDGLLALEPGEFSFQRSFRAFVAGAVARAEHVGDTGASSPDRWMDGLGSRPIHAVVHLYATTTQARDEQTAAFLEQISGGFGILSRIDGDTLPGDRIHFGYRDGIAQPRVAGASADQPADCQPEVPAWHFILQDSDDALYYLPQPRALVDNGGFGVFRVLAQDVAGFERFLDANASTIDRELLAAKMCGRWRNGVPLMLSPDTDQPAEASSGANSNAFDYVARPGYDGPTDEQGVRCPIGSHIRRNNPRSQPVAGDVKLHRVLRRGMPYGPPYNPDAPDDGIERGLLGLFLGVSIESQFEFLMADWVEIGGFTPGLPEAHKDPLIGNNSATTSAFTIPKDDGTTIEVRGFAPFVTTRAGAYLFYPGIAGLGYIATR